MEGRKKITKQHIIIISLVVLTCGFLIDFLFTGRWSKGKPRDAEIVSIVYEASGFVPYFYKQDGNYDNLNCDHEEMKELCAEIEEIYGRKDKKKLTIAHSTPKNSQAVCIYAPAYYTEKCWFCFDSKGHYGYTSIGPGTNGYCVEGESVICPPLFSTSCDLK